MHRGVHTPTIHFTVLDMCLIVSGYGPVGCLEDSVLGSREIVCWGIVYTVCEMSPCHHT